MSKAVGVGKTGNKWYYVITVGYDESGKQKQKKQRGFNTKKEAMEARTKALNEVMSGTYIEPTKTLYGDFLKDWLESKKVSVKRQTLDNYKIIIRTHVAPTLGHIPLSKLTALDLQQFINKLQEEGHSGAYMRKIYSVVSESLRKAERWNLISRNPAERVDPPRINKKDITVWNTEEIAMFLNSTREEELQIAFVLAITTGMRQGEILGLRWSDIDLDNKVLYIRQTLSHDGKELMSGGKTKSSVRSVMLPEKSLTALRKHRGTIREKKVAQGRNFQENDLVICTKFGTPVTPRNLMRTFYRVMKEAKVPKIRFHDLRHTHATLLLMQNVNPKIVADRLGHANVRLTLDTYSHLLPSMQREAVQEIEKVFADMKQYAIAI
ncbi:tyrosine-type recombinase/integrase [Paenibacillus sp. HJGM_3]|uniref:site-specific integrase n=1 Tax=Paenibacillus sp. HJGM_3 TaxID=3379816 RepID=UPI00385A2FA9